MICLKEIKQRKITIITAPTVKHAQDISKHQGRIIRIHTIGRMELTLLQIHYQHVSRNCVSQYLW